MDAVRKTAECTVLAVLSLKDIIVGDGNAF